MHSTLLLITFLLSAAVFAVALTRRLRLPAMLGYLSIGIALGPHGLALLKESAQVDAFAEFGVVFLMFSIGLEFSLPRLVAMRSLVFGLGPAQVLLTVAGTALVTGLFYGQGWRTSLAVGLAVAMSSTAIVAKMLSERLELHSRAGRQTMGVLLFQDLAVVPALILFPALAAPGEGLARAMGLALLQAVLALTLLIGIGKRLIGPIFDRVAHHRSSELFVLTALWIVVGLSFATGQAGLSLALGAFVGGMLISETAYRHQVEADIRPFRDILLGLFFVTVGMMLDIGYVLANIERLLLAVVLLVGGKGLVALLAAKGTRSPLDVSLRTAAQLAQGGEFGLVLINYANALKLVDGDVFQLTISAILASMFIAPFLIDHTARWGAHVTSNRARGEQVVQAVSAESSDLSDHVILCGYGRTGKNIGEFLSAEGIPFLALDLDLQSIDKRHLPALGHTAFGNADRLEVLQAAGLGRARAVVITYPDLSSAERVLRLVRQSHPALPVVVRALDDAGVVRLKHAGATEAIPEVLEGSLMLAAETLAQLGVPMEQAIVRVRAVRAERYASLRGLYRKEGLPPAADPAARRESGENPS
ncbi:cation:proton antiporter [Denitratisoma sp. DHT3]|uniref:cation:proton antiporter n=1 Tax=Denitratisoma sp. DHT3 TaxID=1981880 RepID=UPI0016453499|nr:cation:proton antiporter [Denitratisoma sp. DHT3]